MRLAGDALQFLLQGTLATFKQPHFRQAHLHRPDLRRPARAEPARHPFLVPRASARSARCSASASRWSLAPPAEGHQRAATTATGACCTARAATTRSRAPRGTRPSATCASTASADCPTHGMALRASARRPRRQDDARDAAAAAAQAAHRRRGRRRARPAAALDDGPGGRGRLAAHSPAGRTRRAALPRAVHPLRRVHEGVPEQRPAPDVHGGRPRGAVDAGARAARRLLRAELRPVRPVCPTGAIWEITERGEAGKGRAGTGRGRHGEGGARSRSARPSTTRAAASPGRWPPTASSARSGAPRRPRPSTSSTADVLDAEASRRRCAGRTSTPSGASAAAPASTRARSRTARPST